MHFGLPRYAINKIERAGFEILRVTLFIPRDGETPLDLGPFRLSVE